MKTTLTLIAVMALILAIEAPVPAAAGPECVKRCDDWCAKNFAMKNIAACSQQCQAKHCK